MVANVGGVAGALRYLDAAQHCGLKAVIHFSTTTTTGGTVYPSRVAALVKGVKNHPALLGYLTVKEPSWTHISGTEIRSLYHAFKVADPNHKVVALFGDIPHFGDTVNPYTAGMADIVMVDWYPVETARGGCSSTGSTYVTYGPKWYSTKVRPTVATEDAGHPDLGDGPDPQVHGAELPQEAATRPASQLARQVHEALTYAGRPGSPSTPSATSTTTRT